METRIAALGVEKERLSSDLAALQRGEIPAPPTPLTPDERRSRTRRLAQVLVKSFYDKPSVGADVGPLKLEEKDLERLRKGEKVVVDREVQMRVEVDGKALSEALQLAGDLGMNFFDSASFCSKADIVEELMMAVLEARAVTAAGLRPAVEGAVRSAYGALPGSWDSRAEERLAQARAVQGALTRLEGSVSADQLKDLYETAQSVLSTPEYAMLAYGDPKWRAGWVDRVAQTLELDAAGRPILNAAVDETVEKFGKFQERSGGPKGNFEYALRVRELGAELVRQLSARFPDKKAKIDYAVDPR